MLLLITVFSFITSISGAFIDMPDNVKFVTSFYNTTNCSGQAYSNLTLKQFCYDTKTIDGYPKCCFDMIKGISFFDNASFNHCLSTGFDYSKLKGVTYSCSTTDFKETNASEVFAYIGIVSAVLIVMLFFGCLMSGCCKFKRKDYSTL